MRVQCARRVIVPFVRVSAFMIGVVFIVATVIAAMVVPFVITMVVMTFVGVMILMPRFIVVIMGLERNTAAVGQ